MKKTNVNQASEILGKKPDSILTALRRKNFTGLSKSMELTDEMIEFLNLEEIQAEAAEKELNFQKRIDKAVKAKETETAILYKNKLVRIEQEKNLLETKLLRAKEKNVTEKSNCLERINTEKARLIEENNKTVKRLMTSIDEMQKETNEKLKSFEKVNEKLTTANEKIKLLNDQLTERAKIKNIKYPLLDAVNYIDLAFIGFECWLLFSWYGIPVILIISAFVLNTQLIAKRSHLVAANKNSMQLVKIISIVSVLIHFYFFLNIDMNEISNEWLKIGIAIFTSCVLSLISYKSVETIHQIAKDSVHGK